MEEWPTNFSILNLGLQAGKSVNSTQHLKTLYFLMKIFNINLNLVLKFVEK